MISDDDLQALHRRDTAPAGERAACPTADELFSLAAGTAAPAERDRLVDHVAGCGACAEEVRLMRSLAPWSEDLARRLAEGPAKTGRVEPIRPRRRRFLPLALAAVFAAALVGSGLFFRWDLATSPPGPATGEEEPDVRRGAMEEPVSPAPEAVLARPPEAMTWQPEAGATGYRLKLYDEAANLLWESSPLGEPRGELPTKVRSSLSPGAAYFWTVDVEGPARRRQLGAFWFRLQPPGADGPG